MAASAISLSATVAHAADPVVMKYAAAFPPAGAQGEGAEQLGKYLEEMSNGAIDFQFFPARNWATRCRPWKVSATARSS